MTKKTSGGFQCDGLSPNFVAVMPNSRSYGPSPRLIWHHQTIEDVAAFDFCCVIE
jgi:hypothetical protein